ncbi:hypothetical protein [Schumannella soli]|uniref:LGFP repeat-containing protein n=1 Tax=Schumannella soli TaxID=2590779 RepID=A0A506Y203_9MICO|nr:hypothetical protein [Schumannella soli]TPW75992.1 hypothetical protein FJ657_09170 [Schumannella soli]
MTIDSRTRLGAALALLLAVVTAATVLIAPAERAEAANAAEFDPGYIISDERFFDYNSMSVAEIQAFLADKEPACTSNPIYPCLKNYVGQTNSRAAAGAGHCTAYDSYGTESAATIIYRVSQACRINAQVLLVMLQKEQGFITSNAPTAYMYQRAMGYACPDNAPCDSKYFGFFNQVYSAAWQLRQYTLKPGSWSYRIGANDILYKPVPNTCDPQRARVNIQNQATANLYIYTPYVPNSAALANLYGVGDNCSSYGNRNFWRYFSDWFGSPTSAGPRQINAEYAVQGGANGPLGLPTSSYITIPQNGGGLGRAYNGGSIYWTGSTGAAPVYGNILTYYFRFGGAAGELQWPNTRIYPMAAGDVAGQGQSYSSGMTVYTSPAGTYRVVGAIRGAYWAAGAATATTGFPQAEASCAGALCSQKFGGGVVYGTGQATAGYQFVPAVIDAGYVKAGGPSGAVGLPTSAASIASSGAAQGFAKASIYAGSGLDAQVVRDEIRSAYWGVGGSGSWLGWPTSAQSCAAGSCTQSFQNGVISIKQGTAGASISSPAIDTAAQGLGSPTSAVQPVGSAGIARAYEKGSVYLRAGASTAYAVSGEIRSRYFANGGATGALGWPTSVTVSGSTTTVGFERGAITSPRAGVSYLVSGAVNTAYVALGGATGSPGPATSEASRISSNGGGIGQAFTAASIYQRDGVTTAFPVSGEIRTRYFSGGGAAGALAWPTSQVITSAANGGGTAQSFTGGSIYQSGSGAFAVTGATRDAYWARGGSDGTLGWPTSEMTCTPTLCTQKFQKATIQWSLAGGAVVV